MNEIVTGIFHNLFVIFTVIIKFCTRCVQQGLKSSKRLRNNFHVIISDFKTILNERFANITLIRQLLHCVTNHVIFGEMLTRYFYFTFYSHRSRETLSKVGLREIFIHCMHATRLILLQNNFIRKTKCKLILWCF